jgi:hypothetical protein
MMRLYVMQSEAKHLPLRRDKQGIPRRLGMTDAAGRVWESAPYEESW